MAKRPTPKKRRNKRASRIQHSAYMQQEINRLQNKQNSPFAAPAEPKKNAEKAITKIKA